MDLSGLSTFISNVGFPVAAFVAMLWMNERQNQRHAEESNKFTTAINNNTQAISNLKDALQNR